MRLHHAAVLLPMPMLALALSPALARAQAPDMEPGPVMASVQLAFSGGQEHAYGVFGVGLELRLPYLRAGAGADGGIGIGGRTRLRVLAGPTFALSPQWALTAQAELGRARYQGFGRDGYCGLFGDCDTGISSAKAFVGGRLSIERWWGAAMLGLWFGGTHDLGVGEVDYTWEDCGGGLNLFGQADCETIPERTADGQDTVQIGFVFGVALGGERRVEAAPAGR